MKIKDIKAGGWVRYISDDAIELAKVREFEYDKRYSNGYCFRFEGREYGTLFRRRDFKYSDNVADLIRKGERVLELKNHYFICESFTKDEFVEKQKKRHYLSKEDKVVADKAAQLITRDYGEVIKKLEKE